MRALQLSGTVQSHWRRHQQGRQRHCLQLPYRLNYNTNSEHAVSNMGLTTVLSGACRDNPGREVTLTIQRGLDTKPFPLPVTPDLAPRDNGGVIGVKLGANAKVAFDASGCTALSYT